MAAANEAYLTAGEVSRRMLPRRTGIAYAPGSGLYHMQLTEPMYHGKMYREAGDTLCRTRDKFPALEAVGNGERATCRRCLMAAERIARLARVSEA